MTTDPMISIRNLYKIFGSTPDVMMEKVRKGMGKEELLEEHGHVLGLQNINVDMQRGETTVVMGLSGSGKSTLIRHVNRLIDPTAGEVLVEGENVLEFNDEQLRHIRRTKMSMVFQHFALLPHLTVLQNVAFPLDVQGVDRTTREARAHEMIETVGLKGREDYYPRQLSGGQQQRVAIARSLVTEPDLWFLDEPFSALDPLIRREMQDEFLRLQSMLKKTIVFITHDFDEAIRLADRIAVMKDGRIEQTATPEELMTNPATPYVAEFTRHVNRSKVVKLRSIAVPVDPDATYAGDLPARMTVAEAMEQIDAAADPFKVVETDGTVIGAVDAQTAISVMIGRSTK